MKIFNKQQFIFLLLTLLLGLMTAVPATSMAAQQTVNLETTAFKGSVGGEVGMPSSTVFSGQADLTTGKPEVVTSPVPAILHIITHVINDNGRTAVAASFGLHVKTSGTDVAASPAPGAESPGTTYTLPAGTYVVSEDVYNNKYTQRFSGDSDLKGNITLAPGDNKTVTVTNDDIPNPSHDNNGGGGNHSVVTTPAVVTPTPPAVITPPVAVNPTPPAAVTPPVVTNPTPPAAVTPPVVTNPTSPAVVTPPVIGTPTPPTIVTPPIAVSPSSSAVVTLPTAVTSPAVVTPSALVTPSTAVTRTVTGGQLPKTSTSSSTPSTLFYDLLLLGTTLTLFGATGWRNRKRYE
jgi:hypothetical protein